MKNYKTENPHGAIDARHFPWLYSRRVLHCLVHAGVHVTDHRATVYGRPLEPTRATLVLKPLKARSRRASHTPG